MAANKLPPELGPKDTCYVRLPEGRIVHIVCEAWDPTYEFISVDAETAARAAVKKPRAALAPESTPPPAPPQISDVPRDQLLTMSQAALKALPEAQGLDFQKVTTKAALVEAILAKRASITQ